jgi:type I restriction-modification system DNA methylase subunit
MNTDGHRFARSSGLSRSGPREIGIPNPKSGFPIRNRPVTLARMPEAPDKSLESWIWDAACAIRGAKDAAKYKEFILPLIFTKRLCDVFDDEINRIAQEVGSRAKAFKLVKHDKKLVRFFLPLEPKNPDDAVWSAIRTLSDKIGEQLTTYLRAIADVNPLLKGIIIFASLKPQGRAAVVLDAGAASRGSGNANTNKEKDVRRWFVEQDLIEGVIYLPENLFYNTTAPGIILVLNRAKPKERKEKLFLLNASREFTKGDPKNYIAEVAIRRIADTFSAWKEVGKYSRIVSREEVAKNDFNISPSRYVHTGAGEEYRPLAEIVEELEAIEEEAAVTDAALKKVLERVGARTALSARIEDSSPLADKAVRAPVPRTR